MMFLHRLGLPTWRGVLRQRISLKASPGQGGCYVRGGCCVSDTALTLK